jgi:hypothetical protein
VVKTPKPVAQPWLPSSWNAVDAYAFKALASGTANEGQQKHVLQWLIAAAGTYDMSFRPGDERASAFAEGKRFVGLQIVKLINLPSEAITGPIHE